MACICTAFIAYCLLLCVLQALERIAVHRGQATAWFSPTPTPGPPRGRARSRLRRLAAAWLCGLMAASVCGQARPTESDVKAAYLFNFGKFLRVAGAPGANRSTFAICILGRDPIFDAMKEIAANDSIDDRPVRVLRIVDAAQGRGCDIVYLSAFDGEDLRPALTVLTGADVLTVSDAPDFLALGGMIQFVLVGDHVRFQVNLDAVERTHLVLSSELLRVAVAVKGRPPGAPR